MDDAAIVRIEAKLDSLTTVFDERLKGLEHKIEFGDRSALQTVQILAESVTRLRDDYAKHDERLTQQGRELRAMDGLPARVTSLEVREAATDSRIALLERDRAKIVGFLIGASFAGGGIGAALAQALGGG